MKMKFKITLSIILGVFLSLSSLAQGPQHGGNERLRAMKVGMITQDINLTESQAEKFWPVYNNFEDERSQIFRKIRQLSRKDETLTSDDLVKRQDQIMALRQQELDLTKSYKESFLKVISIQQYAKLMDTERRFNQMLLEKLKERKGRN